MSEIKELRISGFRGVRGIFPLNFVKGNSIRSMVVYGRNGTGKSSLTDAWEWFHTERIVHLSREGAGPGSYPHKNAGNGETFVEIEFENNDLGLIRLTYDNTRITRPIASGNIEKLRLLAPHPCHVRFEDLTRFVYFSKTEKFDALAVLMGFTPQVELQKAFRRVMRELEIKIEDKSKEVQQLKRRLLNVLKLSELNDVEYLGGMNKLLSKNKISVAPSISKLESKKDEINELVVNDPRAKRISLLKQTVEYLNPPKVDKKLSTNLTEYISAVQTFLEGEHDLSKFLLLDLYTQSQLIVSQVDNDGEKLFSKVTSSGVSVDICPLCGQDYHGNLEEHISDEMKMLKKLQELRDDFEQQRTKLIELLSSIKDYELLYSKINNNFTELDADFKLGAVKTAARLVKDNLNVLGMLLGVDTTKMNFITLGEMQKSVELLRGQLQDFDSSRTISETKIRSELAELEKDNKSRTELVDDNKVFATAFELWNEIETNEKSLNNSNKIFNDYSLIVEKYIESSIANVQKRFEIISDNVGKYFEILEQDTDGLRGAVLKLLTDEDRAVELQIDFHGDPVYPAYKYLSESQLNSFGLSVFLASAKYFNANFKFIILDDIINSFDGYKRPRIVELLKTQFPKHQILLLTHDNVWHELLFESFPSSIKKRFVRWEYNHGPIDSDGFTPLEKIKRQLDNDEPVEAGRNLGPYLERHLQEIGEKFEMLVKYNRRNEYTLDPLLTRFATRVKDKLKSNHPLYVAIRALAEDSGFRNLCAHWKNPDIQLTKSEMTTVYKKWIGIEDLARCQEENCLGWVIYNSSTSSFICPCGKTKLEKIK